MNLAIIGATGNVGRKTIEILEKSKIKISELFLVASEKSEGKKIKFRGNEIQIQSLEKYDFSNSQITFFAAGSKIAEKWVPKASKKTVVIDNSKFFRMDKDVPLIVPEVNLDKLAMYKKKNIIANPNCSTIQMVVALNNIYLKYGIKRLVISTYQSVTGTGAAAVQQMEDEREGKASKKIYPHQIDQNCFPHGGVFLENGYTTEEIKLVNETQKIFNDPTIRITATVVRIPVIGGHCESVNIETLKSFNLEEVIDVLNNSDGVIVQDNPKKFDYPMPITSQYKNDVFVGRIRIDETIKNGLNLWIVADNLR